MEQELREAFTDLKNDFSEKYKDLKQDTKDKHTKLFDKVDKLEQKMAFHEGKHSELDKIATKKGSTSGGLSGFITSVVINLIDHFIFRRNS